MPDGKGEIEEPISDTPTSAPATTSARRLEAPSYYEQQACAALYRQSGQHFIWENSFVGFEPRCNVNPSDLRCVY